MKIAKTIITLFFAIAVPHTTMAQSVPLLCKGDIEKTTDLVLVNKPITVYVLLDLQDSTVEINGDWGCYADIATDNPFIDKCSGKLPVSISDAEIKYSAHSADDKYAGSARFTINRYSGSFSISGHASSKPAAKAQWGVIMISANLQCTQPEKKF